MGAAEQLRNAGATCDNKKPRQTVLTQRFIQQECEEWPYFKVLEIFGCSRCALEAVR